MENAAPMSQTPPPQPRKLSREARRAQLIEATIDTIATRGLAKATLTEVAKVAGLSHGLVNFHFESKEKLLAETLAFLADEYRQNWTQAMEDAGPTAPEKLDALLRADFTDVLCTPSRLAAWGAFWGEARNFPLYQDQCGANDDAYKSAFENLCARMNTECGYDGDSLRIARVLRVVIEGVWLDLMTMQHPYGAEEARRTVFTCAAAFYPRHFTTEGLI